MRTDPKVQCRAFIRSKRAKSTGHEQCSNPANEKSGLCGLHERAAVLREEKILTQYQILGKQLKVTPLNALLSLIYEAAGNVQFYRQRVGAMERLHRVNDHNEEKYKAELQLYNEERDRLEKYTLDGLRINLEAKQVQLYEMQAQAIDKMATALMDGLNLKRADRIKGAQIMARELRDFASSNQTATQWQGPFLEAGDRIEFDEDEVIEVEAVEV